MIDASTPQSPGWWLMRLARRLRADLPRLNTLEDYYVGNHPLPQGDRTRSRLYRDYQRRARSNYCGLVVESVKERLHVDGFRAGGTATDQLDDAAWGIWQANNLDADSPMVHQHALAMGRAYVIVGDNQNAPGADPSPLITAEDPRQVIHESSPTNHRDLLAALKIYEDDVRGVQCAVVYLPDRICYFTAPKPAQGGLTYAQGINPQQWSPDETMGVTEDDTSGEVPNPLGLVPVVVFYNRPMLKPNGVATLGEFEDVIDIQDRINGDVLDRLVITRMQAYRQRYMTGVTIETDDNGNPKRPFDPDVETLWVGEDEGAKFGDFQETDITPILNATSGDVTHLAAITRTPPQYLLGQMANLSGDALEAAQAGLNSKVGERQLHFGESWEQVVRLATMIAPGQDLADDAEVVWGDPTQRSLMDQANAGVALQTAGVPWATRMRKMGFSPSDIARMEAEQMQDSIRARLLTPVPTTVTLTESDVLGTAGATPAPPNGVRTPIPSQPETDFQQQGQSQEVKS